MAASNFGDSGTPVVYAPVDKSLAEGDIAVVTVDYDGSSGTAGADLTIVITAVEV
jgi:hypothetical protein